MKLIRSSQDFEVKEPLDEPNLKWNYESFIVKRITQQADEITEIVWYGWGTNWRFFTGEGWTKLIDMQWIPCEEPIYETLYKEMINGNTTS